jgi:hypothetical protein
MRIGLPLPSFSYPGDTPELRPRLTEIAQAAEKFTNSPLRCAMRRRIALSRLSNAYRSLIAARPRAP